mmetsp:Transcript_8395/g.11026  ORF Transcript_8395/g.11026 Transcript_8395/m.11026 type:complete len:257 (+) Transcript_8395:161-931(+)
MAAVLGRSIQQGITCDCGSGQEEVAYYDSPRRGLDSSFAPYYIVVFALNSVAIGAGIFSQYGFHQRRQGRGFYWVDAWYFCNAIFGVLHILAALYIVKKIEDPIVEAMPANAYATSFAPPARDIVERDPPFNPSSYKNMASSPQNNQSSSAQAVHSVSMNQQGLPQYAATANPPSLLPATPPETYARINQVMLESKVVALYILVFAAYVVWHKLYDVRTYNPSMLFVMQCADLFVVAGPASLLFSMILCMMRRREI